MNPIHSHVRKLLAASAALVLGCHSSQAFVTNVTETFDTGLGRFDAAVGNASNGNNFGFSNSTNAGGTAGEIGGTFSQNANAYIADTNIAAGLSFGWTVPLVIKAKVRTINGGNDQTAVLGYFNANGNPTDGARDNIMAGIAFIAGGPRMYLLLDGNIYNVMAVPNNTSFDVDLALSYNAGTGQATLSGTVNGTAVSATRSVTLGSRSCNAFGVTSAYANGASYSAQTFFDNLQYSTVYLPPGTVTETFDTGLGQFDAAVGNTSNGNNFGFSNTGNAGGAAGEIGGTFSQGAPAYVADTTLGGTLTKADPLIIRAKAYSLNGGNDQSAGLGYFTYTTNNTDASRENLMAGIVFFQGSSYSRGMLWLNGNSSAAFQLTHTTFDIDLWLRLDPAADRLYLEGNVDGQSVSLYTTYSTMSRTANAFGVISAYGNGGAPSATAYFDNLQYSTVYLPGAVTETFDTGLGRFDAAVGNTNNGNNFGFSNSSNAGGAAGEIGGTFSQGAPAYVADTTLGGTLTKADPLVIKAKAYSLNGGNDQSAGLGYFTYTGNNTDASRENLMASVVFFQGASYSRGMLWLNGNSSAAFQLSHNTFDINLWLRHDPGANRLYLEGIVDGQSVSLYTTYSTMTRTANAFGVISAYGNGGAPSATAYFDNLQYFSLPPALTTNVFTSSPNPSGTGSNVTFTATIQTNGVTATAATGTVEFRTNGVAFGAATLSSGVATLTTNALPHGSNTVVAAYPGDGNFTGSTNSLVQVVNTLPVAKAITNGAPAGVTSTIRIIGGKASIAPTDADGDPLLVSQVQNPSALLGATVTTDGTNILYTPGLNASGADTVQYVVSDGYGGLGTNTMYVTVTGQSFNLLSGPTLTNNQFQVTFAGIPNRAYAVDDSTNSATGPWAFYTNLTAGTNGLFQLVVTNDPPVGSRFFRTRYVP